MRGIACVQIPTTLLAQVDSSVGGKTAVDLNGIKNLVGAFYQPQEVLISPAFLKTLSEREIKCGLGEIVKYAALNEKIFNLLDGVNTFNLSFLTTLIEESIFHKVGVVQRDEKENGERKSLNVGHTTAHAIEQFYNLSHGESVLYGMWIETKIAIEKGVCDKAYGTKLLEIINAALSVKPLTNPDFSTISTALLKAKTDKKNLGDGKIYMAVAKAKGVWTQLALSYEEYVNAVLAAVAP
jgi:3-dehydroquinate synthase